METKEFNVKGRHDLELSVLKVVPKKSPKAVIQLFHGMAEYKERYIPFMEFMAQNGYAVYIHDHRKHGKSVSNDGEQGILSKEDTWHDYVDDAYFVSRRILKEFPGKEIYIMGHSFGSLVARAFLGEYPLVAKKAVLMATKEPSTLTNNLFHLVLAKVIRFFASKKKRSNLLANTLNSIMQPTTGLPRTEYDWISRDPEVVDKYIEDPQCGYAYTPQFYVESIRLVNTINKSSFISKTKHIPILFIAGTADPVGEYGEGVKEVHRQYTGHGYTQLTLELIEDARHELLNEIDKLTTFEYLLNWFETSE